MKKPTPVADRFRFRLIVFGVICSLMATTVYISSKTIWTMVILAVVLFGLYQDTHQECFEYRKKIRELEGKKES